MNQPLAFRRRYEEIGMRWCPDFGVRNWDRSTMFHLMALRLEAMRICGTEDVRTRFFTDGVEFRRPETTSTN